MKVAVLLICATTVVLGKEISLNKNGCPIDYTIEKLIDHADCNKFYQCLHGNLVERTCPDTLLYNENKNICDWPQNVECKNKQENCNCNPEEASTICAKSGSDGVLVAHEHCNKFYKCSNGKNVSLSCPRSLLYNPNKGWCDFAENVQCGDRIIPGPEEDDKVPEEGNNNNNAGGDNGNDNDGDGPCNCVSGEAASICAKAGSDGVLVAHEHCNKFYKCFNGQNVSQSCPGELLYNPHKEWCDYPANVQCGDRIIPGPEENDKVPGEGNNNNNAGGDNGNDNDGDGPCNCVPGEAASICAKAGSDGVLVAHEHCNKFYKCSNGKNVSQSCPGELLYNPHKEWCDYPANVECGDRIIPGPEENDKVPGEGNNNNNAGGDNGNDNDGDGPCNCVPGEAASICAKAGSDGVFVAHEHCSKFYKCSNGKNVSLSCPGELLYNPHKEWCDYPANVQCGDRIIPGPEENDKVPGEGNNNNNAGGDNGNDNDGDGPCNCVPGEAASICAKAGSDGVLVAHEHCNKFYKCSNGKNVSQSCPGELLYNPHKEWCDYPANVECGDRIIPGPEENDKVPGEGNNNNNAGGDNGNDNDGDGPCNCVPGEAASICAKAGSDGVLVAHEHCSKFYKCSNGKNVSLSCPGELLYNPHKEWCDYPANVQCGDRIIPGPEENDKVPGEGNNNNNAGGDNGNDNDGDGPCNCVPGEAASICAKAGSDGVLVAHEHCNKFYKCSNGKNVSQSCPGELLYNPHKEWCDYPANVQCGDRIIPGPEENDKVPGEGNNNNNAGGDNGNDNDGDGPCNCVSGEAASICAKAGSDGVLVAHEHCNKFYKCFNGQNVSQSCPGELLYNPHKEWCDYPANVQCGDRIIPGPEENDKVPGEGNNNNNAGGDNGNDNNGDGPCNCVSGEAASICAKAGSDGVLVAHEHCSKFYKCSNGKNVSLSCPGELLYNPHKEWCDYPANVQCGDRIIPGPEENDKVPGEGNNNNNAGGDNGNDNDGDGPCNCVPGEAASICAKAGSDGVLVAHDHCNKFYKCSNGKNVSQSCPGELLYNPHKEWCDYPANVQCGDRILPGGN